MTNKYEDLGRPLFSLTIGEFLELQAKTLQQAQTPTTEAINMEKYAYGIAGIAEIFNCSLTTANRIKASGKINKAIRQMGRKIIVNRELAIELAGRN